MALLEVQGIVSSSTGLPLVQLRHVDDEGEPVVGLQITPAEARELAGKIYEAAANSIYEAALIEWSKERGAVDMGVRLVDIVRRYRSDHWGLPSLPQDWRTPKDDEPQEEES